MAGPLKIALHDVPEPEALTRMAQQRMAKLSRELPSLVSCRLVAEPAGAQFEAHVELCFPERQVLFNHVRATAEAAVTDALDSVAGATPLPVAA